ncbi:MAG: tetratricopeptide repeat protein, partial [Vicinamibacteria bacterium]
LRSVDLYRQGFFVPAALSISTLTPEGLYRMGTLFLAGDRTASELKAAVLLHTECVVSLPQRGVNHLDLARRTAQHLELSKRYAQALPDPTERLTFQKRWHLVSAYYFYRDLRSTESESLLASGLQMFPADPDLLYALGAFREASGTLGADPDALREAESIYRTLAESEANLPELDVRLAHVLLRLGRMDEAEAKLSAADSDNGDSLAVWMLRGEVASRQGRWRDAGESFAKALKIDGACQACAVALAWTFERSGQRDTAARFVAEWLALPAPESRDGWWRFLLGPAQRFEVLLTELRSEVMAP